jgi:mannose-6-phosphate isomerase-like protein (cupin superfamily)
MPTLPGSELHTKRLGVECDAIAPDGSEIRLLAVGQRGSMCHCRLPGGTASEAVAHKTVEELWHCLRGRGQVWRKLGDCELVTNVAPGWSLRIPTGTSFQFRNDGEEPLEFLIVTMPPWPGSCEALPMPGCW